MDTNTIATTGTSTAPQGASMPPDIISLFLQQLDLSYSGGDIGGGIFSFLSTTWSIYTVLAYLVSLLLLYTFIYASIRTNHLTGELKAGIKAQEEAWKYTYGQVAKQSRFDKMQTLVDSANPNDWKLAIIEADVLLDESLKRMGYPGSSLGERLKSISPQAMQNLDQAWAAHKVRNSIAHSGEDFVLTQRLARDTIARYRVVFQELGVLVG